MFLILDNYKVAIQEVERVTQAHRDYLGEAYRAGKLLISGPRIPRTGGVIIACVKTREEVDELIEGDPFHKQGIADYEVIEFKAIKYQPVLSSIVRERAVFVRNAQVAVSLRAALRATPIQRANPQKRAL